MSRSRTAGRVVLVAGDPGAVVTSLVRELHRRGATVGVAGPGATGPEVSEHAGRRRLPAFPHRADDPAGPEQAVRRAATAFRRLDAVVVVVEGPPGPGAPAAGAVNGAVDGTVIAGGVAGGPLAVGDPAGTAGAVAATLAGAHRTVRAALPQLARTRGFLLLVLPPGLRAGLAGAAGPARGALVALADAVRVESRWTGAGVGVLARASDREPYAVATAAATALERRRRLTAVPGLAAPVLFAPGLAGPWLDRAVPDAAVERAVTAARRGPGRDPGT